MSFTLSQLKLTRLVSLFYLSPEVQELSPSLKSALLVQGSLGECLTMLQNLTLPLSEGDILSYTKLVPKVRKFSKGHRLSQNVCYLLISTNVLQFDGTSLYHVSDKVMFPLNMLGPIMEEWVLYEL